MDYQNSIYETYYLDLEAIDPTEDSAFIMQSDGVIDLVGYSTDHQFSYYDEIAYYYANYGNRTYQKAPSLILYYSHVTGDYYLYSASYVDFLLTESVGTFGDYGLASLYHNSDHAVLEDLGYVYGYQQINSLEPFTEFTYGSQEVNFGNGDMIITDFYNLTEYREGNYVFPSGKQNTYTVRGENVVYNKYLIQFDFTQVSELYISFGMPISAIADSEYSRGYSNGYAGGYANGVDDGFTQGQNSQGLDEVQVNAFSYIGNAFQAVGNLMSLEVLPNVTLGLCFSIPMVFVLIMTIFKLVRK